MQARLYRTKFSANVLSVPSLAPEFTVRLGVNGTIDFRLWIAVLSVKIKRLKYPSYSNGLESEV